MEGSPSSEEDWKAAEALLAQAEEELAKGDLRQASERIWSAAALAVKAIAYKRDGRKLASHGELWAYVDELKRLDPALGDLWRTAISMHVNSHEGWAPEGEVREALQRARELLAKLRALAS